jgi:hypothetical protein
MLTTLKIDIQEKHLSPSHRDWISDFPYTAPLASVERQDVSPPLVIRGASFIERMRDLSVKSAS